MIAILTADIINSRKDKTGKWLDSLKGFLSEMGKEPQDWEIYRGDAFQVEIKDPEEAFLSAVQIKALLRCEKLDARISIGIGEKDFSAKKITQSNGSAFIRSGELFEKLKPQKRVLGINSGNAELDMELNLICKMTASIISGWLPQSAEFVIAALQHPELSQEELGRKLGIAQAAVSRRQKRSQFELIMEADAWYRKKIQTQLL